MKKIVVCSLREHVFTECTLTICAIALAISTTSVVLRWVWAAVAFLRIFCLGLELYDAYKRKSERWTKNGQLLLHTLEKIRATEDMEKKHEYLACYLRLSDTTIRSLVNMESFSMYASEITPILEYVCEKINSEKTAQDKFLTAVEEFYHEAC